MVSRLSSCSPLTLWALSFVFPLNTPNSFLLQSFRTCFSPARNSIPRSSHGLLAPIIQSQLQCLLLIETFQGKPSHTSTAPHLPVKLQPFTLIYFLCRLLLSVNIFFIYSLTSFALFLEHGSLFCLLRCLQNPEWYLALSRRSMIFCWMSEWKFYFQMICSWYSANFSRLT